MGIRDELRDKIHPEIIAQAHPVKNNPISLVKLFYPKTRMTGNTTKDILKAFKRALANFHPDKTINKSLYDQIRAEEIFKLLSTAKEKVEKNQYQKTNNNYHHTSYHNHRQKRHGWF